MIQPLVMMSNAEGVTAIGDPVAAAGQHGTTSLIHTISIRLQNFRGILHIEGSLLVEPGEWFAVVDPLDLPAMLGDFVTPGLPIISPVSINLPPVTRTIGFSFRGNFAWLRLRMDRTHLIPPFTKVEAVPSLVGRLDKALLLY